MVSFPAHNCHVSYQEVLIFYLFAVEEGKNGRRSAGISVEQHSYCSYG